MTRDAPTILGLILAGGRSSRMGEDKAMLRIDGETLLERTSRILREAGAQRVAISGARAGGIEDLWPDTGPVGGMASAMRELPDGEWLVVPVDMPRLCPAVLAPLLADRRAAATHWQRHPLPMRLTMDARARAALEELLSRPGPACSVAALHARLGASTLPLDGLDTRLLVNCNTPDEWREANT
ncbi:molybdenum cofactor guanylyltransferase [Luteibacter jiangsuensis]|uniref:Molybdenum cofactor guanylyltransferase n=1 Tax=Luteibacter jiangsuensis TaxID=637577 RepID=A0ABX0Q3X4_9GAMM|nr:molybdenum cofactor guanylyltransferase [Luteibacter jiangsuensis]NID05160.1 molybdenum cofactor guanylyltransferase [Luteibacter jiangsuensis]